MDPKISPTFRPTARPGASPMLPPTWECAIEILKKASADSIFPCYAVLPERKAHCNSTCGLSIHEISAVLKMVRRVDPPYSARQAISITRLFLCSSHHRETEYSSPLVVGLAEAFGRDEASTTRAHTPKLQMPGQWPDEEAEDCTETTQIFGNTCVSKRHDSCASELPAPLSYKSPGPEARQGQQHGLNARVNFFDAKWEVFLWPELCCIGYLTEDTRCGYVLSESARTAAQDALDHHINEKAPISILPTLLRRLLCPKHSSPEWLDAYHHKWSKAFMPVDHSQRSPPALPPVTQFLSPMSTRTRSSSMPSNSKSSDQSVLPSFESSNSPRIFQFGGSLSEVNVPFSMPQYQARCHSSKDFKTGAISAQNPDRSDSEVADAKDLRHRTDLFVSGPKTTEKTGMPFPNKPIKSCKGRRNPKRPTAYPTCSPFSSAPEGLSSAASYEKSALEVPSLDQYHPPKVQITPPDQFWKGKGVDHHRPVTPEQKEEQEEAPNRKTTPSTSSATLFPPRPSAPSTPISLEERFHRLRVSSEPPPTVSRFTSPSPSLSPSHSPSPSPSPSPSSSPSSSSLPATSPRSPRRLPSSSTTILRHEHIFTSATPPPTSLPLGFIRVLETSVVERFRKESEKKASEKKESEKEECAVIRPKPPTHVYVLQTPELPGLVKVGLSNSVPGRIRQLGSRCRLTACELVHASELLPRPTAFLAEGVVHEFLRRWGLLVMLKCPFGGRRRDGSSSEHREWFACDARVAARVVEMWCGAVATMVAAGGGEGQEVEPEAAKWASWAERLDQSFQASRPVGSEGLEEMLERHEQLLLRVVGDV